MGPRTLALWLTICVRTAWLGVVFPFAVAQGGESRFDIPAQPANAALNLFAEQAGVSLLFPFDVTADVFTKALHGTYSVEQALEILLNGTGLSASVERQLQVVIRREPDPSHVERWPPSTTTQFRETPPLREDLSREIVVTARRREESLQNVPISISALSAAELELRSIENIGELNGFLPNVSIRGGGTSGGSEGQFVIRGIPGVARYVDGVVQRAAEGSLINVLELERVEVLRGPQGTLFGKNAIGGAIQYVTRKPAESAGANIKATLGSFDRRDMIASADLPAGDSLFTQLTVASLKRDGYVKSELSPIRYGDQNNDTLRFQLLWRPSSSFQGRLSLDQNDIQERQQANVLYDVIESQSAVVAYNGAGLPLTDATHALGGLEQYRNRSTYTGTGNLWRSNSFNVNLDWQPSQDIHFRSITGGRSYRWGNYQDMDASEYAFFEQWFYREGEEFSQEFQLQGSDARYAWTVGTYYGREARENLALRWQYEELAPRPRSDVTEAGTEDFAIFGEGTFHLAAQWSITAGLRYSSEKVESAVFETAQPRPAWHRISTDLSHGEKIGGRASAGFSSITPRLTVEYDWNARMMAYLTYAEGFNEGGINGGAPINGQFISFDEEKLSQYELGFRSTFRDGQVRLNASLFNGLWDNIQIGEVIVPGQITIRNSGAARIRGVEAESVWWATPRLVANLSMAWLDARYTRLDNTSTVRLDSPFALAPDYSLALGATYEWEVGSGARIRLRGDYGWMNHYVTIDDYRLQKIQPAYGLLNGRITYVSAQGHWELALFGTNLTNEWYQLGGFSATLGGVDQGVPSRPRELGITISIQL